MKNPFIYSNDNKRYHTWNYYLRNKFHSKVFKVPLNANFGCPNRDGTCGIGGCTFCSSSGSGDQVEAANESLKKQFHANMNVMKRKWPDGKALAYFQAYTNTYCSLETLKNTIQPFYEKDEVLGICIATRADCLEDDKIAYLNSLAEKKEIWIELGLQTIHDKTANAINRGHSYATFKNCIERLKNTKLKICVHLMNSLPNETKEMMIQSAKEVGSLALHAVKIHMLYLSNGTTLAKQYHKTPFPLLSKEDYIDVVVKQLEQLPPRIIIQRLTGDGDKETQIDSFWMFKKTVILNDIDKEMVARNTYQGKGLETK
ncbi:radical SAM protein (TIGR01212 family) [Breznakia sp. PF5-3]|uniref:TIGR01212 family radical SAM protein n=1 Tax=unclassified Breznakia TaxID=2623764 RepID=UPI0029E253E5|nr:radical SAM protein (TIGR01212 family) [Breznakia sp. PM6-1]MDF9834517.1 radical SAM protein (TIGR01212 family) [Breznakia sp. PF5-3]MDF9837512.1 radical SAM protein (TIGR01212 family) [Breznakia sp. PFB2-8]MDF9859089.1 radical SAM protein (TIGR01212 family) [Breznakia sp. PH5-24]